MKPNEPQTQESPLRLFLITIAAIFMAEVIAMVVVYRLRTMPYLATVLIDATIMTALIFPILYFLSAKPLLQLVKQRTQTANILQTRLRLIQYAHGHSLDELLQVALDEIKSLTGSTSGYFFFLESDEQTPWLRTRSNEPVQNISPLSGEDSHDGMDTTGLWNECVRARRAVVHNGYDSSPHRPSLPKGHAPVRREIAVPIFRGGKIVAILGVSNTERDYSPGELELVSTIADFAWEQILHKQAGDDLQRSEEKFRTLVDWTYNWEFWVDPEGNLVYTSPSCERITGYSPEEFVTNPRLILDIVHPDDRGIVEGHQQSVHNSDAEVKIIEYRLVTATGHERWIEHICRPLLSADQRYLGRRVTNRDITARKEAEKTIRERNQTERLLTQTIHTMQLDIARDLHDTLGQNISYLRMKLDYLAGKKTRKQAEMQLELQSMLQAANESYDLMRGTLAVLQSENSTDLFHLFTRYARQIEERSAYKIELCTQGEPRFMSAKRMRQLFYIYREALNNIEKHAHASEILIEMSWEESCLNLRVSDNGDGFDLNKIQYGGHYGLRFMHERADLLNGSLSVRSASGSGTRIVLQVPYE